MTTLRTSASLRFILMEFLTIFFSTLIGLVSPTGLVVDRVAYSTIRHQFKAVEQLQVRIDNAPSYQILNGQAERVRIAGRGLFPAQDVRIEALEVETDPIDVDVRKLRRGKTRLDQPLQAGVRLVLKEEDLNRALRSPTVVAQLRKAGIKLLEDTDAEGIERYSLINPRIDFLGNNRLRFQVELQEKGYPDRLAIVTEAGLAVEAGRRLQFLSPTIKVNGKAAPKRLVKSVFEGLSEQLDLQRFEKSKLLARVLQLELNSEQLNLATFVRVEP